MQMIVSCQDPHPNPLPEGEVVNHRCLKHLSLGERMPDRAGEGPGTKLKEIERNRTFATSSSFLYDEDVEQQTIIFLGPQGSGKGTQVELLQEFLKEGGKREVLYLEVGAALRAFGAQPGPTQEMVGASLKRGELQPGFISGYLAAKFFIENLHLDSHLLVDGFPRNEENWMTLVSAMSFYKRAPTLVYLHISDEEAVKRLLLRKRYDDTVEGIKKRLAWSHAQVLPIVEHFRTQPEYRLLDIDGERSIEEIHTDIVTQLGLKKAEYNL